MHKTSARYFTAITLLLAAMTVASPAQADFELAAPDGRRVLLKDDGTWAYTDTRTAPEAAQTEGEAVLTLERTVKGDNSCRFVIQLVNNFPYPIGNIVPQFSAYRGDGVIYDTVFVSPAFSRLKPGDRQQREVQFAGITCRDIAKVQVKGGDRCEMGDLDKWSGVKGRCLERVRVVASELVRFEK